MIYMKVYLLTIFLCACATGVSDPIDDPVVEIPENKSAPKPAPTTPSASSCEVDSYWSGNCFIKKTYCSNQLERIDVMCDRGRKLFPWEYIPDPPFDGTK